MHRFHAGYLASTRHPWPCLLFLLPLLLAYEASGYDNTQPGRLPDLLPHVAVERIVDWGADAVKLQPVRNERGLHAGQSNG